MRQTTKGAIAKAPARPSSSCGQKPTASRPATAPVGSVTAKAKPKANTAKAKAKSTAVSTTGRAENKIVPKECLEKMKEVFRLADSDLSGSIQFCEFVDLHREIVKIAASCTESLASVDTSSEEIERQFRKHDEDHNLSLDHAEWEQYMGGILSMIGQRNFVQVCDRLCEEERQRKAISQGEFDAIASNRLLDKAQIASNLRGPAGTELLQLLEQKANPNYYDQSGNNALYFVHDKTDLSTLIRLVEARADPMKHNKAMDSPALVAARSRNLTALKVYMLPLPAEVTGGDQKPQDNPRSSMDKQEQEQEIARASSVALVQNMGNASGKDVRELLTKKANPNYKSETGWTPLVAAVFWGKQDCVEALLKSHEFGQGIGQVNPDGVDAKGRGPLHIAARKGRCELIKVLLSGHANPNSQDCEGWTPLHHAVFNNEDSCVKQFVSVADILVVDNAGFTPWMTSFSPSVTLMESTKKLLEPSEETNFAKKVIPILAKTELSAWEKLESLYSLPGVNQMPANLRMYEYMFHVRSGPNKVRLSKMFDSLVQEFIIRERTGDVDMEPPGPHLDEASRMGLEEEIRHRRIDQHKFLKFWFETTKGPPKSEDWSYSNRDAYKDDLDKLVNEEDTKFSKEFEDLHTSLKKNGDPALFKIAPLEVLKPALAMQTAAHPILRWLDSLKESAAFQSLRSIAAFPAVRSEEEALVSFMDLVTMNNDFTTGELFWQNIYKLWLASYAKLAQSTFQSKIKSIVDKFNGTYETDGVKAVHYVVPPKTYEQMKEKETAYGMVRHDSSAGRRVSEHFLDIVRCAITVDQPRGAAILLEEFFRPLDLRKNNIELVRIVNNFHEAAQGSTGYRDIVLNVHLVDIPLPKGCCNTQEGLGDSRLGVIGEVRINLQEYVKIKKRRNLIAKYMAGQYDHKNTDVTNVRIRKPSLEPP